MAYFLILENADPDAVNMVSEKLYWIFGNVLNIVRIFGTGIALIMLTWMAISYFTADGRSLFTLAERKANIKGKQLRNFAIGVIVFIGASNILYIVTNLVYDVINNTATGGP